MTEGGSDEDQGRAGDAARDGALALQAPAAVAAPGEEGVSTARPGARAGAQAPHARVSVGRHDGVITFDRITGEIIIWDSESFSSGRFPSCQVPATKLASWSGDRAEAVTECSGPARRAVQEALVNGRVRGELFRYP